MQRAIEYIVFFVAVVLLQALLFDNMMFSGLVVPLYYVVFVVLLPVKIGRGWLLLLGVLLGVVMDMSMGTAGINTIATTAVAFVRPVVMRMTIGNDVTHESIPYGGAIDNRSFVLYATMLIVAHGVLFFGLESLGSHLFYTLGRIVCSSAVTLGLTIVTARLFRRVAV